MSLFKSTATFIRSFIEDTKVASVTPSSNYCVEKLCEKIDFEEARAIIEYGPGTGVFTKEILNQMHENAHLYAFETNERFVEELEALGFLNWTLFHSSVEDLKERMPDEAYGNIDYVVSGIPFSFMNNDTKEKILDLTKRVLKPGGSFLAYQTPGHMEDPMMKNFGNVEKELCLRNVPPYYIYESVKTRM